VPARSHPYVYVFATVPVIEALSFVVVYIYCGGFQWTPLQDHLLHAVVDPLWCIDIRPAWKFAIQLVTILGTTERDSDGEVTFH
jgi:hypothetical protein